MSYSKKQQSGSNYWANKGFKKEKKEEEDDGKVEYHQGQDHSLWHCTLVGTRYTDFKGLVISEEEFQKHVIDFFNIIGITKEEDYVIHNGCKYGTLHAHFIVAFR